MDKKNGWDDYNKHIDSLNRLVGAERIRYKRVNKQLSIEEGVELLEMMGYKVYIGSGKYVKVVFHITEGYKIWLLFSWIELTSRRRIEHIVYKMNELFREWSKTKISVKNGGIK